MYSTKGPETFSHFSGVYIRSARRPIKLLPDLLQVSLDVPLVGLFRASGDDKGFRL